MKNKMSILQSARTDLALELLEGMKETQVEDGISIEVNMAKKEKVKETVIRILNEKGEKALGKPCGCYVTIEGEDLSMPDESYHEGVCHMASRRLCKMLEPYQNILVAGLGNREITSDSLGPTVVNNLFVTRHLIKEGFLTKGKSISAMIPGVMAQTGMETGELLRAIIKETKPDVLVCIDALAARNVDRLNRTVQISDTGIAPGSGVGNHRKEITKKTMGVNVIAIGVPTVISIPAILLDAMETDERHEPWSLKPFWDNFYVTPKNIDEAIRKISFTISEALNQIQNA